MAVEVWRKTDHEQEALDLLCDHFFVFHYFCGYLPRYHYRMASIVLQIIVAFAGSINLPHVSRRNQ